MTHMLEKVANDTDYLNNVITTDEMWIYCYNRTIEQPMSERVLQGSSLPLKPYATKSKMKCTVITFFDQEGLVYSHSGPDGQTINAKFGMSKS